MENLKMENSNSRESKEIDKVILDSYLPADNENLVCIEDITDCDYKVFAVYVNGEYDRRINVKRF